MTAARRAVFLDRDGTLNIEKSYLYKAADWEFVPGAVEAVRQINDKGWLAIVVTNQAGVARGMYAAEDVRLLHLHVDDLLAAAGAKIDAYYMCPHHPDFSGTCDCRKPAPGMLLQAARDFAIDLPASYMIGDKSIDIEAAQRAGVTPVLVATGYGAADDAVVPRHVARAADVLAAVQEIWRQAG